jgi:hypothetical protein
MRAVRAPRPRLARMHGTRRYRRLALLPRPAGTRSRPCRGRTGELPAGHCCPGTFLLVSLGRVPAGVALAGASGGQVGAGVPVREAACALTVAPGSVLFVVTDWRGVPRVLMAGPVAVA